MSEDTKTDKGKAKPGFFRRLFVGVDDPSPEPDATPELRRPPDSQHPPETEAPAAPEAPPAVPIDVPPAGDVDAPAAPATSATMSIESADPTTQTPVKKTWWSRLREGLARSSTSIGTGIGDIFTKRKLDAAMLEDLEDVLIRADLGVATATRICEAVGKGRYDKDVSPDEVKAILASEVERVLAPQATRMSVPAMPT